VCKLSTLKPWRKRSRHSRLSLLWLSAGTIAGAISAALLLSGCGTTAKVVHELSKDTNSVTIQATSPWGSLMIQRNAETH
jgi:hypothetical protein